MSTKNVGGSDDKIIFSDRWTSSAYMRARKEVQVSKKKIRLAMHIATVPGLECASVVVQLCDATTKPCAQAHITAQNVAALISQLMTYHAAAGFAVPLPEYLDARASDGDAEPDLSFEWFLEQITCGVREFFGVTLNYDPWGIEIVAHTQNPALLAKWNAELVDSGDHVADMPVAENA